MIEAVKKERDIFLAHFARQEKTLEVAQPPWLRQIRKKAILHFEQLGFPTQKEEAWRFTDISPLLQVELVPPDEVRAELSRGDLDRLEFADLQTRRLVFLNGVFSAPLSSCDGLPQGVRVMSLAAALQEKEQEEVLQRHLGEYARFEEHAFNALNTAFLRDGAFLRIPAGCVLEEPIHLLFVNLASEKPLSSHPRILVLAEENSQVSLVETHLGVEDEVYLSNPVTEIVAGENAVVDHYKLQNESPQAFHIATVQVYQQRSSSVRTTTVSLNGSIIRNETNTLLDGEGAWGNLNGLFLVRGSGHVDNFTLLEHAKPHCSSRELYKGILDDQGRGIFRGRIVVWKGAQKTDSMQTNRNLLLSDRALINTKPQLEIYADDVKCTHGATIGQLQKDALFYLRSRGIEEKAARSILIYAFASEVVNQIRVDTLREVLDNHLFRWLPRGELVREAV